MTYAAPHACRRVEGDTRETVCTTTRRYVGGVLRAPDTLARMVAVIRGSVSDPRVWRVARRIAAKTDSRDQGTLARAVRKWCDARYRYVRDPRRVELLQSPSRMLSEIARDGYFAGDCDEASILTSALCTAIGIRCELHAISFRAGQPLSHVFAVACPDRGAPVELDIVRPRSLPAPSGFPRTLRARV
jgi:transglutaminase-like putative cysteine protease